MKYDDVRNQIRSGDLLAWSHRGWNSLYDIKIQLVRMFTQSEYSHVGTAWVVGGRVFVIEAVKPKVRIYPLSKLGSFYHIPMGAQWKLETEELAIKHVGEKYSEFDALVAFFLPLGPQKVSECAALVLNIMRADGIDLGNRATPDAVVYQAQLYGYPTYYVQG